MRPQLDLSDVILDPLFADRFTVLRRAQTIGAGGKAQITTTLFPKVIGSVMPGPNNDLLREADQQHARKTLSIVTKFRVQGPSPGFTADAIQWPVTPAGAVPDLYVVTRVDPYSRFGAGFVQVEAESMVAEDQPPV